MADDPQPLLLRRDLSPPLPAPAWPADVEAAPMLPSDVDAVHGLLRRAYANGFGSVPEDAQLWWQAVASDSEFASDLCLVVRTQDEIVGLCLCWTSSFVKDLVVSPDRHGTGIGRALLLTAIAALKARGETAVTLKVDARNFAAQRLYRNLGFREVVAGQLVTRAVRP